MRKHVLFLFTLIPAFLQAQTFTIYDDSNTDLISNVCTDIQIAPDGMIWIGTSYSGISVFDGTDMINYTEINSDLVNDFVNDLVFDDDGNCWITTLKGISVYDGTGFTTYDNTNTDLPGLEVLSIEKDHSGNLWMQSINNPFDYQGLTMYDGTDFITYTDYPSQLNGYEFEDFGFTADNTCWLASNGFAKYDGGWGFYPYITTGLWSSDVVAVDASDNVYAAGFAGILKYSGGDWSIDLNVDYGFPENTLYNDMYVDGGYIWIGCSQGFLKYQISTGNIVANYNSDNSPLGDNCVGGIAKDADGILWLATNIGLVKFDQTIIEGIENSNELNQIDLFPNPTNGILNIHSEDQNIEFLIQVSDLQGREVFNAESILTNNNRIDLSGLPSGMYLVKLTNKGKSYSKTIVLE